MKFIIFTAFFLQMADVCAGALLAENIPDASENPQAQNEAEPQTPGMAGHYLSGRFALDRGDVSQAIRHLRQVHAQAPDDMNVAIQLQGLLLLDGKIDEAMALAEDIEDSDVKDPLADLLLVLQDIKDDTPEDAMSVMESAAEEGSVQLWVPLISGWLDLKRHKLTKPLTMEDLNVEVGRAAPLVHYHLALLNDRAGFKEAAAQHYKEAVEDPENPPARVMRLMIDFYERNQKPPVLTPLVDAYVASHPHVLEEPVPVIVTPEDGVAELLYTMGGVMYGAGVVNDAAIYLQLTLYLKPDLYDAVLALGDTYVQLTQYVRANEVYARIAPGNPLYAKAQLRIAINAEHMGKLKDALAQLDALSNASPQDAEALVTKGDLLRIHARFPEAVETYTQALQRLPSTSGDAWAVYFARASCYDREGKWPEAERDLEEALKLKPDQPDVLNYLGFARLERGEPVDESLDLINKAVKERPDDPQIVDSMGWVLYRQGHYQEAKDYLEKALEFLPGDPTVNDHVGDVYWQLGRKTEARFQWERALSFQPEEKQAAVIRKKLKDGVPQANAAGLPSAKIF